MRNIPEDNLAYPVLITLDNGSGASGFLLNTGKSVYLITARHVLFDDLGKIKGTSATLFCQTKEINDYSTTIINVDLTNLLSNGQILRHVSKDVSAILIGSNTNSPDGNGLVTNFVSGVVVSQHGNSGLVAVSALNSVKMIDDVLISNDIYVYGYPSSIGLKQSPQFDYTKPLLRKGIVANVYKPLGTIILDCPIYYGNSGGPVVQVSRQRSIIKHDVIGVVIKFIPYIEDWKNLSNGLTHTELSNSGYSVALAMDYVFELVGFIAPAVT